MSTETVSIIIPTLATTDRKDQLFRAVHSILGASKDIVKVIVCVNGERSDSCIVDVLRSMDSVEVHQLPEPSLTKAIAYGRSVVGSPYFGFLDDDDQLLPGSIDMRLNGLLMRPDCALVAANGIRRTRTGDEVMLNRLDLISADPLTKLFEQNWLPSCGALFRTSMIGKSYFDNYHEYAEWTWLAYCLALDGKSVAVVDELTFIVNDTLGSRSKTVDYRKAYIALYRRMLERNPPSLIRKAVRSRIVNALHDQSNDHLKAGNIYRAAWLHLHSLLLPGGLQFASHSRHILKAALTSGWRRAS